MKALSQFALLLVGVLAFSVHSGIRAAQRRPKLRLTGESFKGGRATLTCEVEGNVTWVKDGHPLQGREGSTLELFPLSGHDDGEYQCCGGAEEPCSPTQELHVLRGPVVRIEPSGENATLQVREGDNVTLTCRVKDAFPVVPQDGFQWTFSPRSGRPKQTFNVATRTISLVDVARDDAGNYRCRASNAVGAFDLAPGHAEVSLEVLLDEETASEATMKESKRLVEGGHVSLWTPIAAAGGSLFLVALLLTIVLVVRGRKKRRSRQLKKSVSRSDEEHGYAGLLPGSGAGQGGVEYEEVHEEDYCSIHSADIYTCPPSDPPQETSPLNQAPPPPLRPCPSLLPRLDSCLIEPYSACTRVPPDDDTLGLLQSPSDVTLSLEHCDQSESFPDVISPDDVIPSNDLSDNGHRYVNAPLLKQALPDKPESKQLGEVDEDGYLAPVRQGDVTRLACQGEYDGFCSPSQSAGEESGHTMGGSDLSRDDSREPLLNCDVLSSRDSQSNVRLSRACVGCENDTYSAQGSAEEEEAGGREEEDGGYMLSPQFHHDSPEVSRQWTRATADGQKTTPRERYLKACRGTERKKATDAPHNEHNKTSSPDEDPCRSSDVIIDVTSTGRDADGYEIPLKNDVTLEAGARGEETLDQKYGNPGTRDYLTPCLHSFRISRRMGLAPSQGLIKNDVLVRAAARSDVVGDHGERHRGTTDYLTPCLETPSNILASRRSSEDQQKSDVTFRSSARVDDEHDRVEDHLETKDYLTPCVDPSSSLRRTKRTPSHYPLQSEANLRVKGPSDGVHDPEAERSGAKDYLSPCLYSSTKASTSRQAPSTIPLQRETNLRVNGPSDGVHDHEAERSAAKDYLSPCLYSSTKASTSRQASSTIPLQREANLRVNGPSDGVHDHEAERSAVKDYLSPCLYSSTKASTSRQAPSTIPLQRETNLRVSGSSDGVHDPEAERSGAKDYLSPCLYSSTKASTSGRHLPQSEANLWASGHVADVRDAGGSHHATMEYITLCLDPSVP